MFSRRLVLNAALAVPMVRPAMAEAAPATTRLTMRRHRLFVPARINGHETLALLDSAAEMSLVDEAFAARIGLGKGQAVTAKGSGANPAEAALVEHISIDAAGVSMKGATIAIIDLADVSRRLIGAPLTLILGRDYFDKARLSIDFSVPSLRVLSRDTLPLGQRFDLVGEFGIETMPVVAEGVAARATVDLGNGNNPLISPAFAARLGVLTDGRPTQREKGGGIGGEAMRQSFVLSSLTVAGETFRDVSVSVDAGEHASDLNIGVSILKHFRIVTDFAQKAIWLDPR
jgi:predicted aspartyl protease